MDPKEFRGLTTESAAGPADAGTPSDLNDAPEPDNDDREQCVPMGALAMPDDQDQMAPPEVGDSVSYQVEGKVTRIEGDEAYVQPTSINGQEVGANESEAEPSPEQQDASDYADLQGMAQKQGVIS